MAEYTFGRHVERAVLEALLLASLGFTAIAGVVTAGDFMRLKADEAVTEYYSHTNPPPDFVDEELATLATDRTTLEAHLMLTVALAALAGLSTYTLMLHRSAFGDRPDPAPNIYDDQGVGDLPEE